jgi:hypothetical protein
MSRCDIELEAVEVRTLSIFHHEDDQTVQLLGAKPWGDVQSIDFPIDKLGDVIAALQAIAEAAAT